MTVKSLDDLDKEINESPSVEDVAPDLDQVLAVAKAELVTNAITTEAVHNPITPPVRKNIKDVVFDLANIRIRRSDNPLDTFENIKELTLKPVYEVIALQSAYRVSFSSLNNDEMIKIRKVSGSSYETNRKMLLHIYNKIDSMSIGKIDFASWVKITSEKDFETLVYGLYCATYPKESDYKIICPHCREMNTLKMSKESLIEVKDPKVFEVVHSIIERRLTPQELIKESSLNYCNRHVLADSRIILDLINPTLHDMLETFNVLQNYKNYEPELFGFLKHIKSIFIPNITHFNKTGEVEYIMLESTDDKLNIIKNLSPEDMKELTNSIEAKLNEYKIEYKLSDTNCIKCNKPIKNINVDMVDALFKRLAEG